MSYTITNLKTVYEFNQLLKKNRGLIIIKYGAKWCSPCKTIEPMVLGWFQRLNEQTTKVITVIVDIDESPEIYTFMKMRKMVQGVPTIHCYEIGNTHYSPNDMVRGGSLIEVDNFFNRCIDNL
jgi:thiol:disulfide interchange protein